MNSKPNSSLAEKDKIKQNFDQTCAHLSKENRSKFAKLVWMIMTSQSSINLELPLFKYAVEIDLAAASAVLAYFRLNHHCIRFSASISQGFLCLNQSSDSFHLFLYRQSHPLSLLLHLHLPLIEL